MLHEATGGKSNRLTLIVRVTERFMKVILTKVVVLINRGKIAKVGRSDRFCQPFSDKSRTRSRVFVQTRASDVAF